MYKEPIRMLWMQPLYFFKESQIMLSLLIYHFSMNQDANNRFQLTYMSKHDNRISIHR